MVYITIHRPDAIPRLLQLGADLVHGVVKGAGQAVEGFARLGLAELGRGTKGVVQQDADSHAGDHSLEESTRFHRVHLFFRCIFILYRPVYSMPGRGEKMRKRRRCFLPSGGGIGIIP